MSTISEPVQRRLGAAIALLLGLAVLAALVTHAPVAYAGSDDSFEWSGTLERGKTIEIKTVNGHIEARGGSGSEIVVRATKRWRRDDPDDVRIEVIEHEGGVTVCTLYPGRNNECKPGKGGRMSARDNDVSVHYVVEVPAGILFAGRAVNGGVEATGLDEDVIATSVNGSIEVETQGTVWAESVNGSIRAVMGASRWEDELQFSTVNGRIELYLPENTAADVDIQTVNGGISTDLPLKVRGTFGPKSVHGTIGEGGARLSMSTVNGGIRLRTK